MSLNGRAKGSRNERQVAQLVTTWWAQLEPDVQFHRTPLSGGWANPQGRVAFKASGDLMTTSSTFPLSTEIKARQSWNWNRVRDGKTSPVWGWWRQCCRAAADDARHPALWFRKNREPWRVMLPVALVDWVRHVASPDRGGLMFDDLAVVPPLDRLNLPVAPAVVMAQWLLDCPPALLVQAATATRAAAT